MAALIYILFVVAVFIWQARKVKQGRISRGKAIGLYAVFTITPVILYGLIFFLFVGLEELFDQALISEGFARSLLLVMVGGTAMVAVSTLMFSIVVLLLRRGN